MSGFAAELEKRILLLESEGFKRRFFEQLSHILDNLIYPSLKKEEG